MGDDDERFLEVDGIEQRHHVCHLVVRRPSGLWRRVASPDPGAVVAAHVVAVASEVGGHQVPIRHRRPCPVTRRMVGSPATGSPQHSGELPAPDVDLLRGPGDLSGGVDDWMFRGCRLSSAACRRRRTHPASIAIATTIETTSGRSMTAPRVTVPLEIQQARPRARPVMTTRLVSRSVLRICVSQFSSIGMRVAQRTLAAQTKDLRIIGRLAPIDMTA